MSESLFSPFSTLQNNHPVCFRGVQVLTARDVRAEAVRVFKVLSGGDGPVFLYFEDAGNFLAAFAGALAAGREVLLPGHAAPGFLREIEATGERLVTDVADLDGEAILSHVMPVTTEADELPQIKDGAIGFFTSGSTGTPKLCKKTLAQISTETAMQLTLWGRPAGPVAGTVSHQHIYGLLFRICWPLAAGGTFVTQRLDLWETVAHHLRAGSPLISSPAHLSRIPESLLLEHQPSIVFSSGGALLASSAKEASQRLGSFPVEILGSTETGGVAWRQQTHPEAAWMSFAGVEVGRDADGALVVRSPFTGSEEFVAMGDGVSLLPDGRFRLHARLDRVVKIEGKRVSLPRVEEVLRTVPGILDAVAVDLPERGGALAAVVVPDAGGERLLEEEGSFRYSRHIKHALAERLESMERPRFWRFVREIPQNAQGKRVLAEIRALFGKEKPEMPTVQQRDVTETEAQFELVLQPGLRWFEGHFPEQPILPGVAQVHIAASMAADAWGFFATGREMSRIKFRRVMRPNDLVTLKLVRNGADRLDFQYLRDDEIMASGAIKGCES